MSKNSPPSYHPVAAGKAATQNTIENKKKLQKLPKPTSPTIFIPGKVDNKTKLFALPVHDLKVKVECHVSTVFATVVGTWVNLANYDADCIFSLPTQGIVTNVSIELTGTDGAKRLMETIVIPNEIAEQFAELMPEGESEAKETTSKPDASTTERTEGDENEEEEENLPLGKLPAVDFKEYEPGIFRLPVTNFKSKEKAVVTVSFMEPLKFYDDNYQFKLPMTMKDSFLFQAEKYEKDLNKVLHLEIKINAASAESQVAWECPSHQCLVVKKDDDPKGVVKLNVDFNQPLAGLDGGQVEGKEAERKPTGNLSYDFHLCFNFEQEGILPTLIVHSGSAEGSNEGHFMLTVTPPKDRTAVEHTRRDFVFLVDKSGSMTGKPFREAIRAVSIALRSLRKQDTFNIVLFDDEYNSFSNLQSTGGPLVPATSQFLSDAEIWLSRQEPTGGGTDIKGPLMAVLRSFKSLEHIETSSGTPYILLVTDGCVENEREICNDINALSKAKKLLPRILTYGIGSYSNWYFLQLLAEIGKGFSDVALHMDDIYDGMTRLLKCAEKPVLKNVQIRANVDKMTVYPFPIPDLFMDHPLNVSGNYSGDFPERIELLGDKPGESKESAITVHAITDSLIPVEQIFIKQRMDLLTARAWLEQSKKLEEQVIALSVRNSIPCAYTTMIAFEMTPEMKEALEEGKEAGPGRDLVALFKKENLMQNKKAMAAIAGAGLVAVGAAAFSFGDVAATGMNLDMLGEVMMGGDLGCCCEPGECIECMGSLCPIS